MSQLPPSRQRKHQPPAADVVGRWARVAAVIAPMMLRPLLSLQVRRFLVAVLTVAALVSQLLLLWLAGELLDLFLSAVELWAELARKHLELTL